MGRYITTASNRNSPPAILLRESYRENGKVKSRTLANLSKLPAETLRVLRQSLKGKVLVSPSDAFQAITSLHYGHVQAVLVAIVAARIREPDSKLATTRAWQVTTLPEILGVSDADEGDLDDAMDWLLEHQDRIEAKRAVRHFGNDAMALYDLSSSCIEGVTCPLAALGHNRDGKKGKLQVNYGLLTNVAGIPIEPGRSI